ncbi:hybrid sensor histidine kinase/response regulator [Roseofilum sp. BLCC_M154]|uniref:histidine kinase n=2 Tax=Roseofilum TaxID=1233426 RepID=A0ABT7AXM1_9CYAN|nr:hybrid sensor histidine kinase/response regulator [Roseofilum acuticapitatum BLCC-M154]
MFDLDASSDDGEMDLDALGETEALDDDLSLELEESSSSEELFDLDTSSDDGEMDLDALDSEDLNSQEEVDRIDSSSEVILQGEEEEETPEVEEVLTQERQDEFDMMMENNPSNSQTYSSHSDASVDDFFEISDSSSLSSTNSDSRPSTDEDDFFASPLVELEDEIDLEESSDLEELSLEEESEESLTGEMSLDLGESSEEESSVDIFDWTSESGDEDPSQKTFIQEFDDFELEDGLETDALDFSSDLGADGGLNFDEPVMEEGSEDLEGLDFSLEMDYHQGEDLSTLFSDEEEALGAGEDLEDIDELNLFGDDLGATDETLESLDFGDHLEPVDSGSRMWQELETFLGVEEKQRESIEVFTQLETFLDEPVTLPSPSLPQEVSHELPEVSQVTEGGFDDLEELLAQADQALGGPPTANATTARSPKSAKRVEQNMRVPIKQLDNLSNLVGELVVNRNSLEQNQERLRQCLDNLLYLVQQLSDVGGKMRDLYERSLLEAALLSSRHSNRTAFSGGNGSGESNHNDGWDHIEMDRFTPFHTLSQETIELIVRVRESSSDIEFIVEETDQVTRQFRQVTTQLQEGLTRTRMVPFAQTADRLPGAVRRIATGLNKQAEIQIEGKETLIDKMIQEQLFDPMTHLINNAMTHGIETPQDRKKSGKNPVGKITVRAFHQGNQTVISVSDDGAGINTARVKSKALEKGLITAKEAELMSRLDIYDLLFHPGFSTKDKADNFAGRGVGMDVVRVALREIRGVITTDSMEGQGTTFTIRLPLTLSISKALSCISNHARIAFPMDGVEDMLDVPKERIYANSAGLNCIKWRDTELPFRPLSELLQYNRTIGRGRVFAGSADDDIISIVILRSAGQYLALQVDQVLGEQEIVIKQLEGPIPKPVGVAGATVLGDGRIMPIADVLELIDLSMGRSRRDARMWQEVVPPEPEPIDKSEPTVLIVDDSITVRELLSMTFVKSGYRVEQARNGLDAWEKLRAGLPCDMIFCDIEMPKLNGLELLERLQGDEGLKQIPMAMLTSRGASKFQQHAATLGAKGYFTKPYLEEALLEAAQRMLKGENLLAGMSQPSAEEAIAES